MKRFHLSVLIFVGGWGFIANAQDDPTDVVTQSAPADVATTNDQADLDKKDSESSVFQVVRYLQFSLFSYDYLRKGTNEKRSISDENKKESSTELSNRKPNSFEGVFIGKRRAIRFKTFQAHDNEAYELRYGLPLFGLEIGPSIYYYSRRDNSLSVDRRESEFFRYWQFGAYALKKFLGTSDVSAAFGLIGSKAEDDVRVKSDLFGFYLRLEGDYAIKLSIENVYFVAGVAYEYKNVSDKENVMPDNLKSKLRVRSNSFNVNAFGLRAIF